MKLQYYPAPCFLFHIWSNWTRHHKHYEYGKHGINQFVRMRFCKKCGLLQEQLVLEKLENNK